MIADATLVHALNAAGVWSEIVGVRDLSGGCIHHVQQITLADGSRLVAKLNRESKLRLFQEESDGLLALAKTKTVLVPEPLVVTAHAGKAVLLMTAIDTANATTDDRTWRQFGEELAALHSANPFGEKGFARFRYGFHSDNHIGSTLQPNSWHDDWVQFNADNRLGFQLHMAIENASIESREAKIIQSVIDRLDQFIPRQPKPSLLHGDLWSGNALPAKDGRISVIDPACSIGDGWADIAMMKLFGGFPAPCLDAYSAAVSDRENVDQRIAVYQLYHVLNHVNIFGSDYINRAMNLARHLIG